MVKSPHHQRADFGISASGEGRATIVAVGARSAPPRLHPNKSFALGLRFDHPLRDNVQGGCRAVDSVWPRTGHSLLLVPGIRAFKGHPPKLQDLLTANFPTSRQHCAKPSGSGSTHWRPPSGTDQAAFTLARKRDTSCVRFSAWTASSRAAPRTCVAAALV